MADAPSTSPSLIVRLRKGGDADAWRHFVRVYAPLIHGFARGRGLQDADAADLTQEVLRGVHARVEALDYDPARGSFRSWLFTIARRKLATFLDRRRRRPEISETPGVLDGLAAADEEDRWERDYQRHVFAWAAEQVRPTVAEATWEAFWLTAVDGQTGRAVAERLGMTAAAVYLARGRVTARLRERIQQWEGA